MDTAQLAKPPTTHDLRAVVDKMIDTSVRHQLPSAISGGNSRLDGLARQLSRDLPTFVDVGGVDTRKNRKNTAGIGSDNLILLLES